ncbi:GNAT family N-acetyltransferase [Streptomyces sp. NRRL F-5122]|uniref:GNAT family N-acetyltransferase n=1 Tax=Streptomyces sp. NRRL F-5122 TaxID=1609098 RepID=UPI00099E5424
MCPHVRTRWSGLPRSLPRAAVRRRSGKSCPTRPSDRRRPAATGAWCASGLRRAGSARCGPVGAAVERQALSDGRGVDGVRGVAAGYRVRYRLARNPSASRRAGTRSGRVAAAGCARRSRPTETYLARIEIHPDHRNLGTGSRLIRSFLYQARRQSRRLTLDTLVINGRARALYR